MTLNERGGIYVLWTTTSYFEIYGYLWWITTLFWNLCISGHTSNFYFFNFFKLAESFFYKTNSITVSLSVNMLLTEENTAEGKPSFVPHKMKEQIWHHVTCIPHQNISLIFLQPFASYQTSWAAGSWLTVVLKKRSSFSKERSWQILLHGPHDHFV